VRGNDMGAKGEYRNGALLVQALDASNIGGGFSFDEDLNQYVAGSTAVDVTHGHATKGLHWESSIFWHWDDGCYHEETWAPTYTECIINQGGGCTEASEDQEDAASKKTKTKDKDKEDSDPVPPGFPEPLPEASGDSDHSVTNTTVGGANDVGRLFWKELIPEE